jgi:hypothetical protein
MSTTPAPSAEKPKTMQEIMDGLAERFEPDQIEWRIGRCGKKADGKVWAMVLAYINNRAVQNRLDHVCGAGGWRNEFREWSAGEEKGAICGISIYDPEKKEWITKWDGAQNTHIEPIKGGLSDAMKRAGSQWGIGRYLYDLEESWAETVTTRQQGWNKAYTKETGEFWWKTPALPAWANPEANKGVVDKLITDIQGCQKLTDYLPLKKQMEAIRDTLNDADYRRLMDAARDTITRLNANPGLLPDRNTANNGATHGKK